MALTVTHSIPAPGVSLWTYDNLDTADTSPEVITPGGTEPLIGTLQAEGTFGGGTVVLQGSNDGTNWVSVKDRLTAGTISLTSDGAAEFSSSFVYFRPLISGGSGDDVNVTISLRG